MAESESKTAKDEERTKRSLRYSAIEGAFGYGDAGIRNSYTTPFALSLNATSMQIGMLSSLHNLAATLSQIPGATISSRLGGRKRVWFFSNIIQKLFWIPIILLPFIPFSDKVSALIILVAIAGFFASIRGPAWSSLMGDIVPENRWGRYFGWRNTIMNIAALVATLVCAPLLIWLGFPAIFTVAFVLGIISIHYFSKIYEPRLRRYKYHHHINFNPRVWAGSIRSNKNFAVFTLFMTSMSFAVNIASPFFAVYMLADLNIGYAWYSSLLVFESLVIIITQRYWGDFCDRVGDRNILFVTGVLICFVPFCWLFITNPYQILIADTFSGFAWSGFNVATFNFMLAASPAEKRIKFTANYTFFTGLGVVAGAMAGGMLAGICKDSMFLWMTGFQLVFLAAFFMRLACLLLLPLIKESRVKETGEPIREIFWHAVAADPARRLTHLILYPAHLGLRMEAKRLFMFVRKMIKIKSFSSKVYHVQA